MKKSYNRATNTGFRGVSRRKTSAGNFTYEASVNIDGNRVFFKASKTIVGAVTARNTFITSLL